MKRSLYVSLAAAVMFVSSTISAAWHTVTDSISMAVCSLRAAAKTFALSVFAGPTALATGPEPARVERVRSV